MAVRRLLPLTARAFGRHTPREVEEMIDGAIWRLAQAQDARAWQTALLMSATGNYKEPITVEQLLGRPPLPLDPRQKPVAETEDAPEPSEKAARARALLAAAQMEAASHDPGATIVPLDQGE